MALSLWERIKLNLKYIVTYIFFPLVLLVVFLFFFLIMRYRIRDTSQVQASFAKFVQERGGRPMLICLNHLTRIDSMILASAVIPFWKNFSNFSLSPWHVLDVANLPMLCPILKTIPIERMGNRKKIRLMKDKVGYLLNRGDLVVIFPEGTRSENGRINTDSFQYGVGDILRDLPNAQVLCAYLRGDKQVAKGHIPPYGSQIDISFEVIQPSTPFEGLRASRDLASQVVFKLDAMERRYFGERQEYTGS